MIQNRKLKLLLLALLLLWGAKMVKNMKQAASEAALTATNTGPPAVPTEAVDLTDESSAAGGVENSSGNNSDKFAQWWKKENGNRPLGFAVGAVAVVAVLGIALSVIAHHTEFDIVHRDAIGSVGEWVSGAGAVAAIYYLAHQLTVERDQHKVTTQRATLDYWVETSEQRNSLRHRLPDENSGELESLLSGLHDCKKDKECDVSGRTCQAFKSCNEKDVVAYLSLIESVGVGVKLGAFDVKTVYELDGPRLIQLSREYEDWITERGKRRGNTPVYTGIVALANRLKAQGEISKLAAQTEAAKAVT